METNGHSLPPLIPLSWTADTPRFIGAFFRVLAQPTFSPVGPAASSWCHTLRWLTFDSIAFSLLLFLRSFTCLFRRPCSSSFPTLPLYTIPFYALSHLALSPLPCSQPCSSPLLFLLPLLSVNLLSHLFLALNLLLYLALPPIPSSY